jgi:hypothetical protein
MVLWLSAALSAIAFAMSMTVRGETERTATAVDDLRSYYLATSGVEKVAMELLWSAYGNPQLIPKDAPFIDYTFPSGVTHVEIIPEANKLDINRASVDQLFNLMSAMGVDPGRASGIAGGIVGWRSPGGTPSFQSPHASFEEIEELMAVNGVTPDIFYGTWAPPNGADPSQATLVRRPGMIDYLTVYGPLGGSDVQKVVQNLNSQSPAPSNFTNLMMQGNAVFTFRSTARLRLQNGQLSDLRRTVGAEVKYVPQPAEVPYLVLRWYDTAWSN